jgi:uncharacterized Zn finger protein
VSRETVVEKAHRYLVAGRLIVTHVAEGQIRATCRGSGDLYELGFERGVWSCSCPARSQCSHLVALGLVTVQPRRPAA